IEFSYSIYLDIICKAYLAVTASRPFHYNQCRNDEQTAVDEKPNTTVSTSLKWSAARLLLVVLILIILKLR
ncbi:MAG: hypothetical protein RR182_07830, partial [Alistipes sp.]